MASRAPKLTALAALVLALLLPGVPSAQNRTDGPTPRRIVSLVPAITEMLFAIGAGPQVVAVSSYDDFPPEVKSLPRVGALIDPDMERILSIPIRTMMVSWTASRRATGDGLASVPRARERRGRNRD